MNRVVKGEVVLGDFGNGLLSCWGVFIELLESVLMLVIVVFIFLSLRCGGVGLGGGMGGVFCFWVMVLLGFLGLMLLILKIVVGVWFWIELCELLEIRLLYLERMLERFVCWFMGLLIVGMWCDLCVVLLVDVRFVVGDLKI